MEYTEVLTSSDTLADAVAQPISVQIMASSSRPRQRPKLLTSIAGCGLPIAVVEGIDTCTCGMLAYCDCIVDKVASLFGEKITYVGYNVLFQPTYLYFPLSLRKILDLLA